MIEVGTPTAPDWRITSGRLVQIQRFYSAYISQISALKVCGTALLGELITLSKGQHTVFEDLGTGLIGSLEHVGICGEQACGNRWRPA